MNREQWWNDYAIIERNGVEYIPLVDANAEFEIHSRVVVGLLSLLSGLVAAFPPGAKDEAYLAAKNLLATHEEWEAQP